MTTANKHKLTQSPIWSRLGSLSIYSGLVRPPPSTTLLVFNIHKPTNADFGFSLFLFNALHSVLLVAKSKESPRPMGEIHGHYQRNHTINTMGSITLFVAQRDFSPLIEVCRRHNLNGRHSIGNNCYAIYDIYNRIAIYDPI